MMVSFVLSFFPRDVLDEILNLIESVSEDFPSYSCLLSLFSIWKAKRSKSFITSPSATLPLSTALESFYLYIYFKQPDQGAIHATQLVSF